MVGLFLIVLIASVAAAALFYLFRTLSVRFTDPALERESQLQFVILTLAAPTLMVVIIAGLLALLRRFD